MPHICMDEIMAILAFVPGLLFAFSWLKAKFNLRREKRHHKSAHKDCKHK